MSKYIDADLLNAEIETRKSIAHKFIPNKLKAKERRYFEGKIDAYNDILPLIDSLQQEQSAVIATPFIQTKPCEGQEMSVSSEEEQPCDTCTNDKGCVTCKDGELWEGKEQSSEDLSAEIEMEWDSFNKHLAEYDGESEDVVWLNWNSFVDVARQFYELGKNSK